MESVQWADSQKMYSRSFKNFAEYETIISTHLHQKLLVCDAGQNAVDTEEAKCLWKNPQHQNWTKQKH